jgi:hypothetical protein
MMRQANSFYFEGRLVVFSEFDPLDYWTRRLNMVAARLKDVNEGKEREILLSLHEHYLRLVKQAEERRASQQVLQSAGAASQGVQTDRRRSKRAV